MRRSCSQRPLLPCLPRDVSRGAWPLSPCSEAKRGEVRRGAGRLASTLIASPTSPSPYLSRSASLHGERGPRPVLHQPTQFLRRAEEVEFARRRRPLSPRSGERERGRSFSLDAHRFTDQPLTLPLPVPLRCTGEGASAPRLSFISPRNSSAVATGRLQAEPLQRYAAG